MKTTVQKAQWRLEHGGPKVRQKMAPWLMREALGIKRMTAGERDDAYRRVALAPRNERADKARELGVEWPPPKRKRKTISQQKRQRIYERDDYRCIECGLDGRDNPELLTLDHRLPLARGGSDRSRNLQTMCRCCNEAKGAKVG